MVEKPPVEKSREARAADGKRQDDLRSISWYVKKSQGGKQLPLFGRPVAAYRHAASSAGSAVHGVAHPGHAGSGSVVYLRGIEELSGVLPDLVDDAHAPMNPDDCSPGG
jgi:hypothetical protein